MSMPLVHDAASGLPVGIQFAAGLCREDVLLRLAGQLEQAMPWAGGARRSGPGSGPTMSAAAGTPTDRLMVARIVGSPPWSRWPCWPRRFWRGN
jgi:amidase